MRFVFLDIDGVANSSRSVIVKIGPTVETSEKVRALTQLDAEDFAHGLVGEGERDIVGLEYGARFGLECADPVCVALINKLLEVEDVALVLSSSHRKFFCHSKVKYGGDEHLRRLRMYLDAMGFKVPKAFSVTPVLHSIRGKEIDSWLNHAWENGIYDGGEPYVILDDAADMLPGQPLVRVNPEHGFTFGDYVDCCKHLGFKEPGLILL